MSICNQYQTPPAVAKYMAEMIPANATCVLEPTPGIGNIVHAIQETNNAIEVEACENYFTHEFKPYYDCIVMNPPFSSKSAFGFPNTDQYKGMKLGYSILMECMEKADSIIALMPWYTISDSDVRMRHIKKYGLKSLTILSRKTFDYARIQTVIIEMNRGWKHETIFKTLNY